MKNLYSLRIKVNIFLSKNILYSDLIVELIYDKDYLLP